MSGEQKYFHDRLVLLLLSVSTFIVLLTSALILFRVAGGRNEGYIVQYRTNLGIGGYKTGSVSELLAFIVFSILVLGINLILSMRVYKIHRQFSVTILGLGVILLTLALVVSNALLILR